MNISDFVQYYSMYYNNATVKVTKIKKEGLEIKGSVDGNKFGKKYDKTVASGFSDKSLKDKGYTELVAFNGSVFYTYNNACYAEGIEIVQGGVNNQDFNMSGVSDFAEVMAVGFTHDGRLVFDKQKNITANSWDYYSAITGAFGIMKDGVKAEWGKEKRSGIFNTRSGRTILGQNRDYIFQLSIYGITGKSGLLGSQLFALCEKLNMSDACCFDGGGSVWARVLGSYKTSSTRLVKNAGMIWAKIDEQKEPEVVTPVEPETKEEPTNNVSVGGIYMTCTRVTTSKGYPTRKDLNPKNGYTDKYIQIGERLKVKDIDSMEGKLDGYCQIDGGDKDGLWFAFDPDYFK